MKWAGGRVFPSRTWRSSTRALVLPRHGRVPWALFAEKVEVHDHDTPDQRDRDYAPGCPALQTSRGHRRRDRLPQRPRAGPQSRGAGGVGVHDEEAAAGIAVAVTRPLSTTPAAASSGWQQRSVTGSKPCNGAHGGGRIRTCEGSANRFTADPL